MIGFIQANIANILVILVFILVSLWLVKRGASHKVATMLFYLVTEAEEAFGGGTGTLKYSAVTTWLYEKLPTLITILFTHSQIDSMIEEAVERMKKYLETNSQARVLIVSK